RRTGGHRRPRPRHRDHGRAGLDRVRLPRGPDPVGGLRAVSDRPVPPERRETARRRSATRSSGTAERRARTSSSPSGAQADGRVPSSLFHRPGAMAHTRSNDPFRTTPWKGGARVLPPDGRGPRATSPMTRVPILMYHSITDSPTPVTRRHAVRPADFAEQMAYLKESGFTPITFVDLASALGLHGPPLRGEPAPRLPDKPIVITFDDGYADFHDTALPVLDKYGFRCTLFLTTGWVRDAGAAAAGRPPGPTLCWSQVREAADQGVEIGGHSHSHPQL